MLELISTCNYIFHNTSIAFSHQIKFKFFYIELLKMDLVNYYCASFSLAGSLLLLYSFRLSKQWRSDLYSVKFYTYCMRYIFIFAITCAVYYFHCLFESKLLCSWYIIGFSLCYMCFYIHKDGVYCIIRGSLFQVSH
jgi:hypothetical protein